MLVPMYMIRKINVIMIAMSYGAGPYVYEREEQCNSNEL